MRSTQLILLVIAGTVLLAHAADAAVSLEAIAAPESVDEASIDIRAATGLRFAVLESMVRRRMIPTDTPYGYKVRSVDEGSPGAEAGLRRGDVILEIDGVPFRRMKDLRHAIAKADDDTLVLRFARKRSRSIWRRNPWATLGTTVRPLG